MKKRLTIVGMLFLAILVMVGCGKNQQATTKEKETKPEELTLYIVAPWKNHVKYDGPRTRMVRCGLNTRR